MIKTINETIVVQIDRSLFKEEVFFIVELKIGEKVSGRNKHEIK